MRGSPFFESVRQIGIEIGGEPSKTPTFYYDGSYMQALFPARLRALRALMPDARHVPARLAPGLGVVAVTCLEYRDTDIGPYNELSIAVLLSEPWFRANLPGRALIEAERRGQAHEFVAHLPVTTEVARRGGVDFYNFPKFIAAIDFSERGDGRFCTLAEGREHILTLSARHIATPRSERMDAFCHLWMDGQPQTAQFAVDRVEFGSTYARGAATLELGLRHPIALQLEDMLVSLTAIQYEYAPRIQAILFGPEHLTLPLAKRSLEAVDAVAHHPIIS